MDVEVTATCLEANEEAPLRVLFFPHAGGSSQPLAEELHRAFSSLNLSVEVWALNWKWSDRAVGHQDLVTNWCDSVVRTLSGWFFDKPFAFFGHSLGALAAVAFTRDLSERQFALPKHLFLSGAACLEESARIDESVLSDEQEIISHLETWGGTDASVLQSSTARSALLAQLKNDLLLHNVLLESLTTQRDKLVISLSVYGGTQDSMVPPSSLSGWKTLIDNESEFEQTVLPGGHFYYNRRESQDALVNAVEKRLRVLIARTMIDAKTLIDRWNSSTAKYPSDKCLHDLFYEAVRRSPNDIAVWYEGKTLTFAELDHQSEILANYLFHMGVRPNRITGIFMEHCLEFVISYIAALKAGGAYMPLEIVYPPDLLARVMEESRPTVILTKEMFRMRLPSWQEAFELDADWMDRLQNMTIPAMPIDRTRTHPDDLAYVVMSSGTTGVPKGICCPHRGAVHSYTWRLENCPFIETDRVASHVFFVWELLRPILGNRPLYVIPDETIYDPAKLVDYIEAQSITRILFTPSLLQLILDTLDESILQQKCKTLRLVWLCGEVVTLELRDRFVRLFPRCELQNLYSVSECHDVSAVDLAHMNPFDNALSAKYASCGKVMPNVTAFVLDDSLNPTSIGVPGELYIGGPCLAIGYLNRPEQTAQRFLSGVVPGETVYKTGDRARFLPNGHLELIGRCDFMVKIRGYSIVLGAVEAALAQHPLVSTAVVLTEGDEGQDKKLVAYIVPEDWEQIPSANTLREFLKEKLPHYAIPSVFVQLDALPINSASGKLDRKKFPTIEQAVRLRNESIDITVDTNLLPQSETEKALAEIWINLLGLEMENISRKTSFFDVGGHSLLATRLVSNIRDAFDVHLTLADIMTAPELASVASRIDSNTAGVQNDESSKIFLPLEAALDPAIYPAPTRKAGYSRYRVEMVSKPPRTVLLTGVTGFLGAHLLHALLLKTEVTVYCVVRASDESAALNRIHAALSKFDLEDDVAKYDTEYRIVPIPGDLSKPLLGVSQDVFKMLASEVDAILHNGAEVNLIKPYSSLKSPNVLGTQEVLRLAVTNGLAKTRVKPVHYISTNGVFPGSFSDQHLKENADLTDVWEALENGYAQSKWVAEQMCHEAAKRGLPISILRPGNMAPSSSKGKWNTSDFMYLLLKGCWEIGAVPDSADWFFDMTPVDFAAQAIVHFVAQHPIQSLGQVLHIQNPTPPIQGSTFFKLFVHAAMSLEKDVIQMKLNEWRERVLSKGKANGSDDLKRLVSGLDAFEMYMSNTKVFDATIATQLLTSVGIKCPEVDEGLLSKYALEFS